MRRKIATYEIWQVYGFDGELLAEYPQTGPSVAVAQPQKEYGYRNGQLLVTAEPYANSAWNKPATQIDDHAPTTTANKAVDGDVDGALWDNYSSATNYHQNSWWQVDLQSVQNIDSITVWGRTDCCPEMTSDFYVFVSDTPFTSYDLNMTIAQPGVFNYHHTGFAGPSSSTGPTSINVNRTGRYVRVQLAGTQYLVLGEVQVWSQAAKVNWMVTDHLGTPRMIVDKTGSTAGVSRHDYLPFGEEIGTGGRTTGQGYTGDTVRQQFTQKERDKETGLDYFLARYYSSMQGRFTSIDPLMASAIARSPQSWNRYSYTFNNPLAFVDPDGRKAVPDDYYADRDGEITIDRTLGTTDRFYVENADGTYTRTATLPRNAAGLVQFPDNGTGFNRYGTVDAGGYDRTQGENVGQGDHFLQPVVAAALFGAINVLSSDHHLTLSLGDMSSSNGSDPWQAGGVHHAGHGHNGNRSGLDIDFRYLNNDGVSFQSPTARSDAQFSVQNNQTVFDTARTFGFTTNYQGTNRGTNGEIQGVTRMGGHNDHGHLGFNRANANIFIRTVMITVP